MTFFDLHVTYGLVAALEPIMRSYRMMPAEALRMALLGLHESMSAERALRSGLVTEIVAADVLTSALTRSRRRSDRNRPQACRAPSRRSGSPSTRSLSSIGLGADVHPDPATPSEPRTSTGRYEARRAPDCLGSGAMREQQESG